MNIYELVTTKFNEFDGNKLVIWENTEKQHKVWLERSQDEIFVYALRNGKVLKPRWRIAYLSGYYNWKLFDGVKLQSTYQEWSAQCKS